LFDRDPHVQPSFADRRHSRFVFPSMDDLHFERADANIHRPLAHPSGQPKTVHRSGAAHLFVSDDHLHLRDLDPVLPELMHQPATPLRDGPQGRGYSEQHVATSAKIDVEQGKFIRKVVSLIVVIGAVLITLYVWGIIERHPRTDDATARANVVGIAPRVSGQILKLNVQDNQAVKKGDVLFEIDPEDYRLVLEKAKAELATVDQQIAQAQDTLRRLEPLLPHGFTTADTVDKARTAVTTLQAQREGAVATINLEQLHLSYCQVIAPFDGRVINLNISAGAHVSAGVPVFSLLDTSKWYVIANFREAEVRHMAPGSEAIVYLSSAPNQRFRGKVQGIGWAVKPEGEVDLPASGVPYVKRELNWVRVAQRFPVRIEVENPDQDLFRMGASAVAIIKGRPPK
jgi:membrane fusion protein, multidrug efflux system